MLVLQYNTFDVSALSAFRLFERCNTFSSERNARRFLCEKHSLKILALDYYYMSLHLIKITYLVTLLYLRASLYPGNAVSATSSAGRISVTKHIHLRWPVGIDKLCHVKNAVRISSSLSRISQDLWFVWDGGQIIIEPSLEHVHFAASHVSNIPW